MVQKAHVFIGSSTESIDIAEAIQLNLSYHKNIHPVCWSQGVFKISNYPLEDLFRELHKSSFGIFVLAEDDFLISRGKEYATVRDNVLFEMGMYMGVLGKDRIFFVIPKSSELEFRIPTDLIGLKPAEYKVVKHLDDIDAVVGPACTLIKRRILEQIKKPDNRISIVKFGVFTEFDSDYAELFDSSTKIVTSFIHSRRWRETNLNNIKTFINKEKANWDVFLPNILNEALIGHLKNHFDDGDTLKSKIIDAYIYFRSLQMDYKGKVNIYLYNLYPTYTLYKFDNALIVSMYPLTDERKPTPTFRINMDSKDAEFFKMDLEGCYKIIKPSTTKKISRIINELKEFIL